MLDRSTVPRRRSGVHRRLARALAASVLFSFIGSPVTRADDHATSGDRPPLALQGDDAIARLRQEGTYDTLVGAIGHARYAITPVRDGGQPNGGGGYEALNPARAMRAAFTTAGVRVQSSRECGALLRAEQCSALRETAFGHLING